MGERRRAHRVLVGKPERKMALETFRRRWKDNIKVGLKSAERAWTGLIWLGIGTGGGLW
jgi:hypothetical protein